MKFWTLALALIAVAGLAACKTTADTRNDRYSIDLGNRYDDRYDGGYYRHCPPGHAKKGWC